MHVYSILKYIHCVCIYTYKGEAGSPFACAAWAGFWTKAIHLPLVGQPRLQVLCTLPYQRDVSFDLQTKKSKACNLVQVFLQTWNQHILAWLHAFNRFVPLDPPLAWNASEVLAHRLQGKVKEAHSIIRRCLSKKMDMLCKRLIEYCTSQLAIL